jgi:hypothetical protein
LAQGRRYLLRHACTVKSCTGKGESAVASLFSTSRSTYAVLFNISESVFLHTKCFLIRFLFEIFFFLRQILMNYAPNGRRNALWAPYNLASFPIRMQLFHRCYCNCPLSYSTGQAKGVTYSEFVFVASVIQREVSMRHIV